MQPNLPRPGELAPRRDPRDLPGTDDHARLMHPHGDALTIVGFYRKRDLMSWAAAAVDAHTLLSTGYLRKCAQADVQPEPLCDATHAEIVLNVEDLPHSLRPACARFLGAANEQGLQVGILRAWRHFGLDCEAAEASMVCRCTRPPTQPPAPPVPREPTP